MELTVTLSKGDIVLRTKDDTYLAVRSYLSGHESNALSRYEMQADERVTHERKLLSGIGSSLSCMKSLLPTYRITDTFGDDSDSFTVTFEVSERFDFSRKSDVKRLVEEYLYKSVTAEWWKTNYPEAAGQYEKAMELAEDALKKLFLLRAPFDSVTGVRSRTLTANGMRVVLLYKEEMMSEIHGETLKMAERKSDMTLQTDELRDETALTRYMNRSVGVLCSKVNAYLYHMSQRVDNNRTERTPVYEFQLVMPDNWDSRLFDSLADEMHGYVVNSVLFDWMKGIDMNAASVYNELASASLDEVKHIVTLRKGRVRRPSYFL